MSRGKWIAALFATTMLSNTVLANEAMAQAAAPPSDASAAETSNPAQASDTGIADIVVTAQRRSQNLQSVPLAITAVSGDALRARNIPDAVELAKSIPNLQIKSGFASSNPTIFMRGIGINDYNAASAGAVGVTIDEVFFNSTVGQLFQVYDLDRVEVLKGPQGTLYGRNTTGGVLSFYTKKPTFEFNPELQINYGRFNEVGVQAATSFPIISDTLAGRVSLSYRHRDGIKLNSFDGSRLNNVESIAGRVQLLFKPSDNLEINAKFEIGSNRSSVFTGSGLGTIDPLTGLTCSVAQIRAGNQCGNVFGYVGTGDPYAGPQDVTSQPEHLDAYGARVGIVWSGEAVSFTSITGWNLNKRNFRQDIDSSPVRLLEQPLGFDRSEQQTQEVRVSSTGSGPFQWIVGGFFLNETLASSTGYEVGADANPTPSLPYLDLTGATTGGLPVFSVERNYRQRTTSYAAFAHLTYMLTDRLKATFGGRYSWDRKTLDLQSFFAPVDPILRAGRLQNPICCLVGDPGSIDPATGLPTASVRDRLTFSRPTWNVSLDYKFDRTLLYASYSRGVRSGGFNAAAISDPLEYSRVNPEKIDAFELGFKSDLSRSVRWNATAFYYTGKLQVFTLRSNSVIPIQILDSAGVEGYGIESELQLKPLPGLTASAFVGLFHGRYTSFPGQSAYVGRHLVQAPDVSLSGSVQYKHPLGNDWSASISSDASYQSTTYFQPSNDAVQTQAGYVLVNGRFAIGSEQKGLEVSLWVKNLTNRTYLVDIFDTTAFGFYQANYSVPRTFGVALSYRY